MKRGRQIDLFHINEIERSLEVDTQHKTDEKLLSRVFEKKNSKEFSLNSMFFLIVLRLLLTRKIPYSLQKSVYAEYKSSAFHNESRNNNFKHPLQIYRSNDVQWADSSPNFSRFAMD